MLSRRFGSVVRAKREAAGLSQEKLAEKAGIHPTYVGLLERGLRNSSLDVAERIAKALGFRLSDLIRGAELSRRKK